ncbi:MAG: hypothetical protein NTW86_30015 [Candidatus Sumerlaeota bacterium]|nr:hypothetical protein [Candidatus Sumerlaeota bacterium]
MWFLMGNGSLWADSPNLLANGGFEGPANSSGAPSGWSVFTAKSPPAVHLDEHQKAEGRSSFFLEATTEDKAVVVSDPIPVAPGETLRLRISVRAEAPSGVSGVALAFNAGFVDRDQHHFDWSRTSVEPLPSGQWRTLEMEAKVPPGAAYATLQAGVSRGPCKTWWDGAELNARYPLAVRFDLSTPECEPGVAHIPLVVWNRDPALGDRELELKVQPGGWSQRLRLPHHAEQRVLAEFDLRQRGKVALSATLKDVSGLSSDRISCSVQMNVTVPPLLQTEPPTPTHFCVGDGPPRLEGRIWIHETQSRLEGVSLSCVLKKGKSVFDEWRAASLPGNPIEYKLSAPDAGLGDYTIEIALTRGTDIETSATLDWHVIPRRLAKVTISERGYPVVDGREIFPIGIFNAGRFEEMAQAGFNVTHGYNAMATKPGQVPDNARAKKFLDDSAALGMKTLMLVTHGSHARTVDSEFVRRVRMFRNHPGLLAWDEEEGIARGEMKPENLARMSEIIHREDPNHPFMVGDCSAYPVPAGPDRAAFFPDNRMDMGMWWWYPFPLKAQAADALQGQDATAGLELALPTFLTMATTRKPLWSGVQSYKKPTPDGRYPTPEEYRAQAYLAVIVGAKGLMYYVGGSNNYGVLNHPEEAHWKELKALASELCGMAPVFMAPEADLDVRVQPPDAPISVRLKATPAGKVLLAVNRVYRDVEATIVIESQQDTKAAVRFEQRIATVQKGVLTDRFAPLAVHVYDLP